MDAFWRLFGLLQDGNTPTPEHLEGIAADSTLMRENAAAIWEGLPFAGHTTGFYMARTIRDGLGRSALDGAVSDPFSFIPKYNQAAVRLNRRGESRPVFSAASLEVISGVSRAARADVR